MTSPFTQKAVVAPRKWYQKIFASSRPDAAANRIANAFVDRDPGDVTPDEIGRILREEQVLGAEARRRLVWVWQQALEVHLSDDALTDDEMGYLDRLRIALNLSTGEVERVHKELAQGRFQKTVDAAFADGQFSYAERHQLGRIGEQLRLPDEIVRSQCSAAAGAILQAEFDAIIAGRRYSPLDEARLRRRAEELGIANLSFGPETDELLKRFRLLWEVEAGHLPQVHCGLNLQRKEICHASFPASWHELRTRTVRVNYVGPTARVRVCRGVYLRAGSFAPQRVTREELTAVDVGTAYITSKRLIFDGTRANKALRYSSLLGIEVFSDAIMVEKATGRSPYLFLNGDIELTASILSAAMAAA